MLLALGSSAIGLYFSSRYAAYNPETQQRVTRSGMLLLLIINLIFIVLLAYAAAVALLPAGYLPLVESLASRTPKGWFFILLYWLTRPFFWPRPSATTFGLLLLLGIWAAVGGGFLAATARRVEHGIQVQIVYTKGRRHRR